jgi:hypothetical protein
MEKASAEFSSWIESFVKLYAGCIFCIMGCTLSRRARQEFPGPPIRKEMAVLALAIITFHSFHYHLWIWFANFDVG